MAENRTILCIDDDNDSCDLLQILFESEGYQVTTCSNGPDALKLTRTNAFAAIVLDNFLAGKSGVDICREIRTYDQTTPIVFYSAASYPKDQKEAIDAGAQAYLIKPNDFEKITWTVERLIGLRQK